jgi:hypothetical protein
MIGKENDEKLHEIIDRENLNQDCAYIRNIKNEISETVNKEVEEAKKEFIKRNVQLNPSEILAVCKFVEFYKNRT